MLVEHPHYLPAPSILDRLRDLPFVADVLDRFGPLLGGHAAQDTSIAWEDGEIEDQSDPPRDS